jgi:hypothetical protein
MLNVIGYPFFGVNKEGKWKKISFRFPNFFIWSEICLFLQKALIKKNHSFSNPMSRDLSENQKINVLGSKQVY